MSACRRLVLHRELANLCTSFRNRSSSNNVFLRGLRTSANKQGRWSSRNGRNSNQPEGPGNTSFEGLKIENGPIPLSRLWKPLGFTVAFSSASFAGAAVWQYETMRAHAIEMTKHPFGWIQDKIFEGRKQYKWRQEVNRWWNGLSEGEKLFVPICFANTLVFCAWRIPQFQSTMVRYFCSNPASRVMCWPMVLSTFSHYSAFHLFANMYVLHSFSTGAVAALGKEQFLALYMSAGVISSLASYIYKAVISQPGLSLGASGAIMAVLSLVCTQYPETTLSIIFLPFITFTAGSAIKVIMALDATGVILGWKFFDHAAHLGGALCGIAWCYWGNTYIWKKREPLLEWWHALRGPPRK